MSSSNAPAIQIRQISKRFKLYSHPSHRLVEWISGGMARRHQDFWALRDVSFDVEQGQCLGLIGANGSGKSTLLKILTGTLTPTSGSFDVRGKVLSLLELGTGFSNELTGRQNVIETASLLGFPKDYAPAHLAEIIDFAGLGDFFDRPFKTYSSGMRVRLAFSMFVFMQPDVFIVDEALAVGDVGFQRKCYRKIEEMLARGVTCLLVSHDLAAITQFCQSAVVLSAGQKIFQGPARDACNVLNKIYFGETETNQETDYGDGSASIDEIWFEDLSGSRIVRSDTNQPIVFCYRVRFGREAKEPTCGFHIKTVHGAELTLASSDHLNCRLGNYLAGESVTMRWTLDLNLNPGTYFFGCGCYDPQKERFLARRVDAMKFPIMGNRVLGGILHPVREVKFQREAPASAAVEFARSESA